MAVIPDDEITRMVHRVLHQILGASPGGVPELPAPKPVDPPAKEETGASEKPVVAMGADHGGFALKEVLKGELAPLGFDVVDVGTHSADPVDYPDIAHAVANLVNAGRAWRGIIIDGAGIGSCIVANKIPGVRAALAYDYSSALNSREHNDSNVLTLGAGLIGANLAKQILKIWLGTDFGGGRHSPRVAKIAAIEKLYLK